MKTKVAMKTIPSTWIIFSINILIILIMIPKSTSDLWYWYSACDNTTMFANNSQYESNLNTLFRYLSSNATKPNGYHKAISSNGNTTNETIYGHFLCRGDANVNSCQNCVNTATTTDLPKTYCPNRKEATIWYNNCLVRYSNHLFFGRVDLLTSYSQNTNNITGNMTRFMELMRNMMVNDIGVRAAFGGSKKKFATNMVNYTISLNRQNTINQTIYGLGQCTPDLKKIDCLNCINISVSTFFVTQGARSWTRSCVARFELYPFFDLSSVPPSSVPPLSLPSPPPLSSLPSNGQKFSSKVIIAIVVVPIVVVLVGLLVVVVYCTKYKESKKTHKGEDFTILESLQYDLRTLRAATDDFSNQNKLGQGGFGCVYKGTLSNGQLVAVKRLSMNSSQGLQEFKNEVLLVAKLQHRNLVRLLGFCFEGPEKLLVYEYMPNKSLDNFIFDPDKQRIFDWGKRYKNIKGIARGMMYLHHDSQLRIIHRDLKASNVLLDVDMNSKIADFGMARLFGMDQTQSNTSKVVGTYGYMSPEYILYGQISLKSDVYSFGVLILEIISGKKNSTFYHNGGDEQDLLSYAWKKWKDGKLLEFVDPAVQDSCSNNEVERCIQLGLICVQDSPNDRPTMATVVVMLDSYSVPLPVPKEPGFFMQSRLHSNYTKEISSDQSSSRSTHLSVNDLKTQSLSLQPDI